MASTVNTQLRTMFEEVLIFYYQTHLGAVWTQGRGRTLYKVSNFGSSKMFVTPVFGDYVITLSTAISLDRCKIRDNLKPLLAHKVAYALSIGAIAVYVT